VWTSSCGACRIIAQTPYLGPRPWHPSRSLRSASAVGAGGIGEVYRAGDTKLGRDVGLKILPDVFADDADRLTRFQREAQVLASLNHPHKQRLRDIGDAVFELRAGLSDTEGAGQGGVRLERNRVSARLPWVIATLALLVAGALLLTSVGLVIGCCASVGLTRFLKTLLFGVTTTSAWVYGTVAGVLLAMAFLASMVPARRALRADPVAALRSD
jgi:hypothetical protein